MGFTSRTAATAGQKSSRKGKPNKVTESLRNNVYALLNNQWNTLIKDIEKLTPKERVNTFIKLLEFTLPKLIRNEIKETSTVEELLSMTPEERRVRINELKQEINGPKRRVTGTPGNRVQH